jgi:hypothetical protein
MDGRSLSRLPADLSERSNDGFRKSGGVTMNTIPMLYLSGSIGLGHVMRDLVVARALRALEARIEIH